MNRRSVLFAAAAVTLAFTSLPAFAKKPEIFTGLIEGVAIGGYDAISYFSGEPVEGKAEFSTKWKDAEWHFATGENRDVFVANPEKYAPQYGGYCAFAVSKGAIAKGDPKAWTVIDGKLYLNFNEAVRTNWREDTKGNISKANSKWPKVLE
jgi:YHS domain-containing protein